MRTGIVLFKIPGTCVILGCAASEVPQQLALIDQFVRVNVYGQMEKSWPIRLLGSSENPASGFQAGQHIQVYDPRIDEHFSGKFHAIFMTL